jgi:hypothetical protein
MRQRIKNLVRLEGKLYTPNRTISGWRFCIKKKIKYKSANIKKYKNIK